MKALFFAAAILSLGVPAKAEVPPKLPVTKAEFYYTGEIFAHCSAHWDFMASIARSTGKPATAEAFDGQARGWVAAGEILLVEGMEESRQVEAESVFGAMIETHLAHLKAVKEVHEGDWSDDIMSEFKKTCVPWLPYQKAIVAGMRGISTE